MLLQFGIESNRLGSPTTLLICLFPVLVRVPPFSLFTLAIACMDTCTAQTAALVCSTPSGNTMCHFGRPSPTSCTSRIVCAYTVKPGPDSETSFPCGNPYFKMLFQRVCFIMLLIVASGSTLTGKLRSEHCPCSKCLSCLPCYSATTATAVMAIHVPKVGV